MLLVQLQVKPSFAFLGVGASEATTFHFWRATHPSPFRASGEISQHSPFRCIHIFQKLVMINEFFQRKVGSHLFSKACWFFSQTTYFSFFSIFFLLFFICLFLFLVCFFFFSFFFMRYFAIYMHIQGIFLPKHTYIFCEVFFVYIHAYLRYLST